MMGPLIWLYIYHSLPYLQYANGESENRWLKPLEQYTIRLKLPFNLHFSSLKALKTLCNRLYSLYTLCDGRDPTNPHVVCDKRSGVILKKKSYKYFICITTHTCKKERHITYINLKFNFNEIGSIDTSWSAEFTPCLHSRHDQL